MGLLRASVWPCLALAGLVWSQSVPVSPSNTSSYNPNANANDSVVMVTSQLQNSVPLLPLTHDALTLLTGKVFSSSSGINIVAATQNSSNLVDNEFVYVSCDPDAYPGFTSFENTVNNAINVNVSAIIFYSTHQPFCVLNGSLPHDYQVAYSTVNTANASNVEAHLTGMYGSRDAQAMLLTLDEYNNALASSNNDGSGIGGSSPSTAVAMIILYSITGIITALFLLIIVTGAVRAHRHPERYGPRNVLGRPRQGRAKGIARAMLDTIPIVKFNREEEKPEDMEMTGSSHTAPNQANMPVQDREAAAETHELPSNEQTDANKSADEVTPAIQEMPDTEKNGDNSLGCSICTEDFEEGQDLRVLPCKHRFHPACVDPWLLDVSGTCPLCRVDLRPTATTEATGENTEAENTGALPPPLDPSGTNGGNRRRTIVRIFDRRRLNGSTREERIAAIRDYRQEQQSREPAQGEATQETEQNENESRWRRVRRSLRLGGGAQTNSMVEPENSTEVPEVRS